MSGFVLSFVVLSNVCIKYKLKIKSEKRHDFSYPSSSKYVQNLTGLNGIRLGIIQVQKKYEEGLVCMLPTVSVHNSEHCPSEKEKGKKEF